MFIAISLHQTKYAAQQSGALRKIIMASSAATPAVIATNNLTFGTLPPSSKSVAATTRAVIAAAILVSAHFAFWRVVLDQGFQNLVIDQRVTRVY